MTPVIYVSNYVWKKQSTVGVTDLSLQECVCVCMVGRDKD